MKEAIAIIGLFVILAFAIGGLIGAVINDYGVTDDLCSILYDSSIENYKQCKREGYNDKLIEQIALRINHEDNK